MKSNPKNKKIIARLLADDIELFVNSPEASINYLEEENINYKEIISNSLQKIKQLELRAKARSVREAGKAMELNRAFAEAVADKLISDPTFSLKAFIEEKQLSMQYRNFDLKKFNANDIKELLIKFFMLKGPDHV